jgi:hypothetical protein
VGICRDDVTGEHVGFREVAVMEEDSSARNSTLLSRAPGDRASFTFGLSTNMPFTPGGMDADNGLPLGRSCQY